MTAAILETRPLYGIGTVARLTRTRPETLRIWERRYGLGASHKADNGRRLYTQTDLEHLQIVVSLVSQGFRIGEIASMERKTLEALQEQGGGGSAPAKEARPKVLFIGTGLCGWLDQHAGCLSNLDSRLLRADLDQADLPDIAPGEAELVIVESGALSEGSIHRLVEFREALQPRAMLVFYEFSSQRWLAELDREGIHRDALPLTTENFASEIRKLLNAVEVDRGVADAGDLATPRSRLFNDAELQALRKQDSVLACGCTNHLSDIIQSLANFEEYSSNCSVENWSDAATHACVYAYTNQARWLMEKALQAVLEEHGDAK